MQRSRDIPLWHWIVRTWDEQRHNAQAKMSQASNMELVTSLRYDEQLICTGSRAYMPHWHRTRLINSIKEIGWVLNDGEWLSTDEAFIALADDQVNAWVIEQDLPVDRPSLKVRI